MDKQINLLICTLFFIMVSCVSPQAKKISNTQQFPNIVWITSEDNSKHYMSLFDSLGVETPHIERLAKEGVLYENTFSNSPVCSVARSTLMSGCYTPRFGAQYHRKIRKTKLPDDLKLFPFYLREAGYYTVNNPKEDYNMELTDDVWDESSKKASWKNRAEGQPFFYMVNIKTTHEGRVHFNKKEMNTIKTMTPPEEKFVFPFHPNTELFRYTNALYRDKIVEMDEQVGEIVSDLKKEGVFDNTIIFYFGDNGGVLPRSKGYVYETGLHIPLVVYVPPKYRNSLKVKENSTVKDFVSFIDFAPTVLALAGIEVPKKMDGEAFLGKQVERDKNKSDVTYGYADRFDEKYDFVRSVRKGKYKYIRNFKPYNIDALWNDYRYRQMAFVEWEELYKAGKLNPQQSQFFEKKPIEQLYDLDRDPFELENLAENQEYSETLRELRNNLNQWILDMPDLSFYPEYVLINEAMDNPEKFGVQHKTDINRYLSISNLLFENENDIEGKLFESLKSDDPWTRYWAITTCISSEKDVSGRLYEEINTLKKTDSYSLNRAQAVLCLAMKQDKDPVNDLTEILYQTAYPAEALAVLNTIVLIQDGSENLTFSGKKFKDFNIQSDKIKSTIKELGTIKKRLKHLNAL